MPELTASRAVRWLAPALLLALWAAYYAPALFGGETFYFRDLFFFFRPLREAWAATIASGNPPYLNTGLNLGQPMLADPGYATFYPGNLLFLALPFDLAWRLYLAGHVLLAACGTYLLARTLGASRGASFAAAGVFAFGGPVQSALNQSSVLVLASWAPWIGWLALRAWREGGWWVSACGVALGIQALAGEPTTFAWTTAALAAGWAWGLARQPERAVRFGRGAAVAAIGAFLACAQWIPALMWMPQTDRGASLPFRESAAWWSLHPLRLAEFLVPRLQGNALGETAAAFWGSGLSDAGFPYLPSVYLGAAALVVAPLALRSRWGRAALVAAGAGTLLSLGHYLPGYEAMHRVIPFFWVTRYPEKFVMLASLGLAVAVAAGVDEAGRGRVARGITSASALVLLAWLGMIAVGTWGVPSGGITPEQDALRTAAIAQASYAVVAAAFLAAIGGRWVRLLVLPALLVADVAWLTQGVAATRPVEVDDAPPALLTTAPQLATTPILHLGEVRPDAYFAGGREPLPSMRDALHPYDGLRFGVTYGAVKDTARTMSRASAARREAMIRDFGGETSLAAMRDAGIGAVVVLDPLRAWVPRTPPFPFARIEADGRAVPFRVLAPHAIDLDVEGPARVVVQREAIPGWRAEVDGTRTRVGRSASGLIVVHVEAGRHGVTLRYRPPGMGAGLGAAAIGVALAFALGGRLSAP
ncbi:MAG TPA: hypothetical protein VF139_17055 [Candidatus Polarisedimenticolaceae bacterium]